MRPAEGYFVQYIVSIGPLDGHRVFTAGSPRGRSQHASAMVTGRGTEHLRALRIVNT